MHKRKKEDELTSLQLLQYWQDFPMLRNFASFPVEKDKTGPDMHSVVLQRFMLIQLGLKPWDYMT